MQWVVRYDHMTSGNSSAHIFLSSSSRVLRVCLIIFFTTSTCPLDWGWYGVEKWFFIRHRARKSRVWSPSNYLPLFVIVDRWRLKWQMIVRQINQIIFRSATFFIASTSMRACVIFSPSWAMAAKLNGSTTSSGLSRACLLDPVFIMNILCVMFVLKEDTQCSWALLEGVWCSWLLGRR